MNQIYDDTLVLEGFSIEKEKNKGPIQEIEKNELPGNLNPRYFEEIMNIDKVKNKVFSSMNFQYSLFGTY
jgi:hypothetical protein